MLSINRFVNIISKQSDINLVRSDNDATLPEVNLASSDCPTEPDLKLFTTGHLPGIDFEKIASHIESCNICLNKMESSLFANEKDEFLKHIKPIDEIFISELQTPSEALQKAMALAGRGDPVHHIQKYRPLFAKPFHEGDLGSFGKFRIIAEIGHGGMGMVFDAYDTLANRRIALKTLRPDLLGNQTLRKLFLEEAQIAAKLVHPNIVLLLDVDTIEGVPYITMPLLKGESLQEFLITNPHGVGRSLFLHIARQLISAIEHLHSKGMVHRDIKPSNIFLETGLDGKIHVMLLDFGLARLVQVAGQSQLGLGTPEFSAPEQLQGTNIDTRADIFSLGRVFEKMLHGLDHQPPFQPVKKFTWNFHSDPLADLIRRMTDPIPDKRPTALRDVLKSLESKRSLNLLKVGALILPFVLVAMALIYFSLNHKNPSLDNSSITKTVTIEPIITDKIALDLSPSHVFSGVNPAVNSISGNGRIFANISYQNTLTLNYANDPTKKTDMELPFGPNSIVLNQDGNLLAAGNIWGDIAIINIPVGKVVFAMHDKGKMRCENLAWGGRNSDVLLFSKSNKLFKLKPQSQHQYPNTATEIEDLKVLNNVVVWENVIPLAGSDFCLANLSTSNLHKRLVVVCNIEENKVAKFISPTPYLDINNKKINCIGWIYNSMFFFTQNRNLFEYVWDSNGNNSSIIGVLKNSSELPLPPDDIVWLDPDHFVALTDIGGSSPSLNLYNRANYSSFQRFETNGEWVKQLKKLDGNSFAAFCKSGKVLTYTLSKSLAN